MPWNSIKLATSNLKGDKGRRFSQNLGQRNSRLSRLILISSPLNLFSLEMCVKSLLPSLAPLYDWLHMLRNEARNICILLLITYTSQVHFPELTMFIQGIRPSPRLDVTFRKNTIFTARSRVPTINPQDGGPPLFGCPRLVMQCIWWPSPPRST